MERVVKESEDLVVVHAALLLLLLFRLLPHDLPQVVIPIKLPKFPIS